MFFTCEIFKTRMSKIACVKRQEGEFNLNTESHISSEIGLSFEICRTCNQGKKIREELFLEKIKPQRGKGTRKNKCAFYKDCLNNAAKKNWRTFNCENCPLYKYKLDSIEVMKNNAKPKNTRICKTDGCDNITLSPTCPYCPSCMARKKNKARIAKKKAIVKPDNSPQIISQNGAYHDKPKGEIVDPDGDTRVVIEFGGYMSIFQAIKNLAEEELRPVDMQVIYMLKNQLKQTIKQGE